ncbi:MAG TPA: hypothetical protein VM146_10290 [Steroidobacteraceae bacterium]|nr:hypothetical protein [Steroidobacteraceae bacterium]
MAQVDCEKIDSQDVAARNLCRKQQQFMQTQLQQATAEAASCPQSLAQPSVYYRALRDLANRGDVPAQRCFIQGYFGINRELGLNLRPEDYDEYPNLARKFIDNGFERGDWSVVRWLSKSRTDVADSLLARAHPMGLDDRVNAYKIRRLLMLGNQRGLGTLEQDDPKYLVEHWRTENWLTPEQLEEAEGWAQTQFQQHFTGSQEGVANGHAEFCADK